MPFKILDKRFHPDTFVPRHGYPIPGPQAPSGTDVMEDVFFLTDAQWRQAGDKQYDFVVIGTSFCALAFATKALEHQPKAKILFVERGPFFLPAHFQTLPRAYAETLGGKSETFPWTIDRRTEHNEDGYVRCCHGSVPFFGGRSTVWSTWCPVPTEAEMEGWPKEVIAAAQHNYEFAKGLLRVQNADEIDSDLSKAAAAAVSKQRPVYGSLQKNVQGLLRDALGRASPTDDLRRCGITRIEPAPLASSDEAFSGVDFLKYSVPGDLLELKLAHPDNVDIKLNCVVSKIVHQDGYATALKTSCGVLPLNQAQLVLAMGALPPATLVRNSFSNSFSELRDTVGAHFSAHFITSIIARVPRGSLLDPADAPADSDKVGACYIPGAAGNDYRHQFHIQLSMIADKDPVKHAATLLRYMPDVVATASPEQLKTSKAYVVLVCAVLGELDVDNANSGFSYNPSDEDLTTNSTLRVQSDSKADILTWETMNEATFAVLEQIGKKDGKPVEYWVEHVDSTGKTVGEWKADRPHDNQILVPDLVHESSTLPIGDLVDLDYKLKCAKNVFVTGASLWPRGGAWNPTLTMVALAADLAEKLAK